MKRIVAGCLLLVVGLATFAAEPTITINKVAQRYPWNGLVDFEFTITGDSGVKYETAFSAKDMAANEELAMATVLKSDGTPAAAKEKLLPCTYRWVWDAQADLPGGWNSERVKITGRVGSPLYLVVDLSGGSSATNYPVSHLDAVPSGGWTTAYKTTKLVLRKIDQGTYKMQNKANVTLTTDFYIGVFEVTQKQWALVTGSNPSSGCGVGDAYPVYDVSYNMIRGASNGAKWPSSSSVDSSSFLGKLRSRTGIAAFDLPTEAQWEYACRAGTTTTYSYGGNANGNHMWYNANAGSTKTVGTKTANPWGLYDMHGNVWEWCLDWYKDSLSYGTNPQGAASGTTRVGRGGSWRYDPSWCTSSYRYYNYPSDAGLSYCFGFRLALTP